MNERWLAVVGFEGAYEVSDLGRVRSLDRIQCDGRRRKGRILMHQPRGRIYIAVHLYRQAKLKTYLIHRLVLEAFVGPCPEGMQSRHLDGNSKNNTVINLKWGSPLENHADKKRHGTTAIGESNNQAKLRESDVIEIRQSNDSGVRLSKRFNVTPAMVSSIRLRKNWVHVQ